VRVRSDGGEEGAQLAGVERTAARQGRAGHVLDVGRALVRLDVHEPETPRPPERLPQRAEVAIRARRCEPRGQRLADVDDMLGPEPVPRERPTIGSAEQPGDGVEGFALRAARAGREAGEVGGRRVLIGREGGHRIEGGTLRGQGGQCGNGHRCPW
jgi:hypothetical protein